MATQALRYLSGTDGYLPISTGMVIAHVRKESEFPINSYVQYISSPARLFMYDVLGRDDFIRLTNDERYAWEDGDDRPQGISESLSFQKVSGRTSRRDYPWRIGYEALELTAKFGGWDPKPAHMDKAISLAMTNRTYRTQQLIQTQSNWPATNYATANQLNNGAGTLVQGSDDPNSPNYLGIFKALSAAAQRIHLLTNGKVRPSKTRTVVGPNLALRIAQTSEIQNYCREGPAAQKLLEEGFDPQYEQWGLPRMYKGFRFIVEDSPMVNTEPNVTTNSGGEGAVPEAALGTTGRQYVFQDTSAVMLSQVGGLDGTYGTSSYSTVQCYHHKGLLRVSAFESAEHERISGHVTESIKEVIACPFAGFFISGVS